MHGNVQKFYCNVNRVLFDFKDIPSDVKSKLIDTYCLDLYGSQLWKCSKNDVIAFYTAWRKVFRRIWKIPSTTHCNMLPSINKAPPTASPFRDKAIGGGSAFDLQLPHSCHSWWARTVKFIVTFTRLNVIAIHRLHISEISIHNSLL